MLNKRFLLGTILTAAVCLSACKKETELIDDFTTTTASQTVQGEVTGTGEAVVKKSDGGLPDVVINPDGVNEYAAVNEAESDTGNPETGLVYFIQPEVTPLRNKNRVSSWEPRDTEVKRGYHYDSEWDYLQELIFAFSNFTNEPVTVDSIQIVRKSDGALMNFKDGSDTLKIDFTVQSMHKTDYILRVDDFDYYSCESGIYKAVVKAGGEEYEKEFFINNSGLYTETLYTGSGESTGSAPDFLNEEQRHIFAKAHAMMWKWFWCDNYMPKEYTDTHTADDFMAELYEAFTEDYAKELAAVYIDENGGLINIDGGRGSDITYFDHCFLPVSAGDDQVTFKAVVTYAHSDFPYDVSFEEDGFEYRMVNTENGWRVDNFSIWN